MMHSNTRAATAENPLLKPFGTLHETAAFSRIQPEHFRPAIEAAIEEARAEIRNITNRTEPADFENTIEALERSGRRLDVIQKIFFNLNSAETSDELQQIAQEIAPVLTAFGNDISMNKVLFRKVRTVYEQQELFSLSPEQKTLLEDTYQGFVRNGAKLNPQKKEQYRNITEELSKTALQFQQNVLAETNAFELQLTEEADLSGLPGSVREAAAQTARQRNKEGWIFTLRQPSYVAFMKYADRRDLRKKMFRTFSSKGNHDNACDNKELICRIVSLKLEKARMLGYPTHAAYILERRMAGSPQAVNSFLQELHRASRPFAEKEFREVQQYARENGFNEQLERWDWAYYSEKLKNARYGFNEEELKPYFRLEKVIEGVFGLAKTLYGLDLKENPKIEVYHPEVKAYEVFGKNGRFIAVLYLDFFPREGKRPGAWMTDYRDQYQENGRDHRPHISVVTNFTRPTESTPSLLSFDELTTFLHEFGHALHGMLSQCRYSQTSGTNVYWDFVELPSQIHENWAYEKQWLDGFAVHYQTGKKIPETLIEKIVAAKNFQSGYLSERQLSFGMLDMAYYNLEKPMEQSIPEFESWAMAPTELFPQVEGTLISTSFAHIFSGGYDAGYYSYKWAEVLEADAFSVFLNNGIFDRNTADAFRKNILERGGSEHPMLLYKRFRGKEPAVDALLERSGLKK
ncbi:MAG: M3 family metallopeptidase [Mangrovibacterium sp.]